MRLPKQLVRLASTLFPQKIADFAYDQLMNPQVRKLRDNELETLDLADKQWIKFRDFKIQTYKWGHPDHEKILLIHGWEGQAGNFSDLVYYLLEANYYVIAFDAPAHGFSSRGNGENILFEFVDLVAELIKKYQCKKLVSHSFGGVATTNALFSCLEVKIDKYVLLTTPNKFSERLDNVAKTVGLPNKIKQLLIDKIESTTDYEVSTMGVSNVVDKINVREAIIFHDKNDSVIPIEQAKIVCANWKNCTLKAIEGTGHFRILRTESVLNEVVAFLN
ncbi:MAG: alpha/beta hydrolase [Bacteroidota bacterium]